MKISKVEFLATCVECSLVEKRLTREGQKRGGWGLLVWLWHSLDFGYDINLVYRYVLLLFFIHKEIYMNLNSEQ